MKGVYRKEIKDIAWSRSRWIREKLKDGSRWSVRNISKKYPHLLDSGNVVSTYKLKL